MFEMRPGSLAVTLGMLTRISNERSENPDPVESICTTWEEDEIEDQRIHLRREGEGGSVDPYAKKAASLADACAMPCF